MSENQLKKEDLSNFWVYLSSGEGSFDQKVIKRFSNIKHPLLILNFNQGLTKDDGKIIKLSGKVNCYKQEVSLKKVIQELQESKEEFKDKLGFFLVKYSLTIARAESLGAKKIILPVPIRFIKKLPILSFKNRLKKLSSEGTNKDYKFKLKLIPFKDNHLKKDLFKRIESKKDKQICLISGGIDSTVAVKLQKFYGKEISLLQINYGQSSRNQENWCVEQIKKDFEIKKLTRINLTALKYFGGSALLNDSEKITKKNLSAEYVPFRNTIFLSFALLKAEVEGDSEVILGAHPDDTMALDGRKIYIHAFNKFLELFKGYPKIIAPLFGLGGKPELIEAGNLMGINWIHTWSCHDFVPVEEIGEKCQPCGECGNCITRYSAFKKLGLKDPLTYKISPPLRIKWAGKSKGMDKLKEDLIQKIKD